MFDCETKIRASRTLHSHALRADSVIAVSLLIFFAASAAPFFCGIIIEKDFIKKPLSNIFGLEGFNYFALIFSVVLFFFVLFAASAVRYGREYWFWQRSGYEYTPVYTAFCGFKHIFRACSLWINLKLISLFWYTLTLLPAVATAFICYTLLKRSASAAVIYALAVCTAVLSAIGLVFAFIIMQRYALSYAFIFENPSLKARQAVKESKKIMFTNEKKLAALKLSFSAWFLSCIFILPIFYVAPYYKLSVCAFSRRLYFNCGKLFFHSIKVVM